MNIAKSLRTPANGFFCIYANIYLSNTSLKRFSKMKFALMITSSIQQSQRCCLFEKTLVFTLPHYSHIGYFFCFLVDCILAPWWLVVTTAKLHSTNSSSAQIRILLATCQNFAIMRPSDDGPS